MSEGNVQIVRRIYDGWAKGEFDVGIELYDPHVLLVLRPEFPDAGAYRTPAEIAKYMQELLVGFEEFAISGDEFLDAGDSVVVGVTQRAIGPRSGLPVEMSYFQVWTFRGEAVIRIESIKTRPEALKVVNLAE